MKKTQLLIVSILGLFLWSCSIAPKEIQYGHDACYYCSMTVVDRQHAAQLVTKTGKTFNFDAVECLVHHLQDNEGIQKEGLVLVNTFSNPGKLYDATQATFLISESIPSPMGAFLTAFSSREKGEETLGEKAGEFYTWEELLDSLH
jgi:copper chaperone NosL